MTPPWEGRSKHFTREFGAFAVTLMREVPVKRAGQILGKSDSRMWRMHFAHVKAAYARLSFDNVGAVGADEMNRRKGHNYLTMFADLVSKRVHFATPGKGSETWEAFAAEMFRHNGHPKSTTQVAIDKSAAYIKGVRDHFGNAQVVHDKFHVIRNVVEASDQIRKLESRIDAASRERLERTRWLLRKNSESWTEKEAEKWESIAKERGVSGLAHEIRLVLQGINERKEANEARQKFQNWRARVQVMRKETGELMKPMAQAARMVESHLEGIFAHWAQGLTTAFMEGLNSLYSAVKRRVRGYRTVEYMIAMLHLAAGKLTLLCY